MLKNCQKKLGILVLGIAFLSTQACVAAPFAVLGIAEMAALGAGAAGGAMLASKATENKPPAQTQATPEAPASIVPQKTEQPVANAKSQPATTVSPAKPAEKPTAVTPLPAEKTFDSNATLADARKAKKEQGLKGIMFQDRTTKAWFLEDNEGCTWKLRGGKFCKI